MTLIYPHPQIPVPNGLLNLSQIAFGQPPHPPTTAGPLRHPKGTLHVEGGENGPQSETNVQPVGVQNKPQLQQNAHKLTPGKGLGAKSL